MPQESEYHPLVFQLDLCVLAYQVYNQSLIWPLDPWFEAWARPGSSRRDNMMAETHRMVAGRNEYRGPGSTRTGWPSNPRLDPIITRYEQVQPWVASVTADGVEYRVMSAPRSIIERIQDIRVGQFVEPPGPTGTDDAPVELAPSIANPVAVSTATDHLYAFEGGTGAIEGNPPAWGLLGIVLERERGDGGYDVHIVYRGSQSGSAYRAAFQGFVLETGNPDWVTDMEIVKLVGDERFSSSGQVLRGIRDSTLSSLGPLRRCLEDIGERRGEPPTTIHVSGHSLGGVLATQLAAALVAGGYRDELPTELQAWPWSSLHLTTFGSPKAGDDEFADHFDSVVAATRVWVDGDPITEFPLNAHVGTPYPLHSELTGTVTHEPSVIRRSLITSLRWKKHDLDDVPDVAPWRAYPTLARALVDAERHGTGPADLVTREFEVAVKLLIEIAGRAIENRSSYKVPFTKTRSELRRRRRKLVAAFDGHTDTIDELSGRLRSIRGIQPGSDVEDHIRRLLTVREAAHNGWTASDLLDDPIIAAALGTQRWVKLSGNHGTSGTDTIAPMGPAPDDRDSRKVRWVTWMRRKHYETVNDGSVKTFRRRRVPTSGMPHLIPACSNYPAVCWAPKDLLVPAEIPPEAELPRRYVLRYYALGKIGWDLYSRWPINPEVSWDPSFPWNGAFPPTGDGWEHPTSDETFARLRVQGPNPWLLRRVEDGVYEVDYTKIFEGILPPIVARFGLLDGSLVPTDITVGEYRHEPGDPTWDRAKRIVNAADVRYVTFGRHLLDVHFIVGQAYALSTYSLPTWHRLRPFMAFFTYGTLQVSDFAYKALVTPKSYFISSGFINVADAEKLFTNGIADFDLDQWNAPADIAARGLDGIEDHPYVNDAMLVWPAFAEVVERHLDELHLDDAAIAADLDLQTWYLTLAKVLPNTEPGDKPLDRARLSELLTALLWNNVVHEICGDLSPILGSEDVEDKAIVNLDALREVLDDGRLTTPLPNPSMADVFLIDQASYTSRFNVGGNNLLAINAAKWVDDPKLRDAILDLQRTLRDLEVELVARNTDRPVRFARMLPSNWEASVSF